MKYLLIFVIKLYWKLIPVSSRRKCIFKISCSKSVYDKTLKLGFFQGLKELIFRMKNCNNQYELTIDIKTENLNIILKDGSVLSKELFKESVV